MEHVQEAMADLNLSAATQKKNRIQVSNTKKPLFFYVNLAKRYMQQYNEVELSALGMAKGDSFIWKVTRLIPLWPLVEPKLLGGGLRSPESGARAYEWVGDLTVKILRNAELFPLPQQYVSATGLPQLESHRVFFSVLIEGSELEPILAVELKAGPAIEEVSYVSERTIFGKRPGLMLLLRLLSSSIVILGWNERRRSQVLLLRLGMIRRTYSCIGGNLSSNRRHVMIRLKVIGSCFCSSNIVQLHESTRSRNCCIFIQLHGKLELLFIQLHGKLELMHLQFQLH
ncbi:Uncharacterized protein EJ110_NYTH43658 [Nymphaea thermarum]|nr:Uncharacterized protein EJ110_NYTH43658 [Nymphaea thermarum]